MSWQKMEQISTQQTVVEKQPYMSWFDGTNLNVSLDCLLRAPMLQSVVPIQTMLCTWPLRFCHPLYFSVLIFYYCFCNPGSNKKSELMLMRRTRAYGSSCSQVILVYLHPFRRSSLFCSQKLPKNHLKSIFLGFRFIQGHWCWHS